MPFAIPNRACTFCVLANSRKEEHVAFALMISLMMIMRHVLLEGVTQGRFSKQDQPRQALLFDRAHPPLCIGIQVW